MWPDSDSMSILLFLRSIGTLPTACTASVWNITPAALASSAISSTGKKLPVSLLAHITDTTATRSVSSRLYSSRSTRPLPSTFR